MRSGLLLLFMLDPNQTKSMSSVENICGRLWSQYYPDKLSGGYKYKLLYPLIKSGVIEFYGNGQVGLSPSSILIGSKNTLICNVPKKYLEEFQLQATSYFDGSLLVLDRHQLVLDKFIGTGVPIAKFNFSNTLSQLSSLDTIIRSWTQISIIDTNSLLFLNEGNKWVDLQGNLLTGVYRVGSEAFAQRLIFMGNDEWRIIPTERMNIDAFSVARIWARAKMGCQKYFHYDVDRCQVNITDIFFPLFIERLLFINTILNSDFLPCVGTGPYYINKHDFKKLNYLLLNKTNFK